MQNYCRCGPLHVVRVEEMVTGSWGCFTAGAEARPLRCLFLSRVTRAVWKAPVSGSVEPHKCNESGSSPMCTELQAHGNTLKNGEAGEIKPIWWLIRKRRGLLWKGLAGCPWWGAGSWAPGRERFENEEGVLQGVEFLLERRVCIVVRAQGGQARKL